MIGDKVTYTGLLDEAVLIGLVKSASAQGAVLARNRKAYLKNFIVAIE